MQTWRYVQGEIAKTTRVCAYDRAGLGFSDTATRPADVRNMADDLRRLVAAAGVATPFVLVGHSLGGEIAVYAAATTPTDVAGLVLVDPAFADDLHALEADLPPKDRRAIGTAMAHALERDRTCLEFGAKRRTRQASVPGRASLHEHEARSKQARRRARDGRAQAARRGQDLGGRGLGTRGADACWRRR